MLNAILNGIKIASHAIKETYAGLVNALNLPDWTPIAAGIGIILSILGIRKIKK